MPESYVPIPVASTRALGGLVAIFLFILTLAAFVIQSSLTQYVQGSLGFRQPFFLLYIAHSSLTIMFPTHLLYLLVTSRKPLKSYVSTLKTTITDRLSAAEINHVGETQFPMARFTGLIFALATGINIPGLLWYAAVSLTSIGDVTALWNTNSFWVYVLTVWLYRMNWEFRKLGAVILASVGVLLDVYGGSTTPNASDHTLGEALSHPQDGPTAPVLGDILTFIASVSYALYQVGYKRYAALPNDPEGADSIEHRRVFSYESLSDASDSSSLAGPARHRVPADKDPGSLPFGLYANLLTSCMGLCTAITLAFAFPILHWLSIEQFTLPPDKITLWCVVGIASAGVVFNSCFMILLGIWGPILTSVGSLLTIVLVLITDFLFNHGTITIWSLLGSGMIVAAFGVLAIDMIQHPK
ncbi:hypothetical protein K439DRAFT_1344581 [Ramaria rubella]|nr:hypothetical protein K439DRAFT_1344581 [Ramaria rubella]